MEKVSMEKQENMTLEEHFSRLEQILAAMEEPGITLDRSFELYKEGLTDIKAANELLDGMEKAMLVLNENGELEEF